MNLYCTEAQELSKFPTWAAKSYEGQKSESHIGMSWILKDVT